MATVSCGVDSSEIGTDFFTGGVLDYSLSDTSTVKLSTIAFEKLQTNSNSRILVGTHADEKLGRITASSFFQVAPSSSIDFQGKDITYDYLALHLNYDDYSYYDTASMLTLSIHRVVEKMKADGDGYLYNTSSFSTANESLGELTFSPWPNREDSIEIKLSDTLGKELFAKAMSGHDDLSSTEAFLKYFHGLAILTDTTSSSCMIGFSKTPEMRIYYTDRSTTPITQKYISLSVSSGNIIFSNIQSNRVNTKLYTLSSPKEKLPSESTDNISYLQAGTGLALRIDMPYLRDLKQVTNFYVRLAVLEVYVVKKSNTELTPLPHSFSIYKIDKNNTMYEQFLGTPILTEDPDLQRDTHYTLNVTSFVKEQMELQQTNENGLVFLMNTDYAASADRLYAAGKTSNYNTRLILYYTTVNN